MQNARAANMPKDKVEAAIRRASGQDAVDYQEILYEGYAPHGIAVLVEAATDNPTRTVAQRARALQGARRATSGPSAASRSTSSGMGVFRLDATGIDADELELALIDHGLDEMREGAGEKGEPQLVVRCAFADLGRMQRALEERGIHPVSSGRRVRLPRAPWSCPRSRRRTSSRSSTRSSRTTTSSASSTRSPDRLGSVRIRA